MGSDSSPWPEQSLLSLPWEQQPQLRDVERIIQVLIKGDLVLVEQAGNQELICIAVALPWLPAPQILAAFN